MQFQNRTSLDSARLHRLLVDHTAPFRHDRLVVCVRNSRGAPFSGVCYYREARILINLGRDNAYPYSLSTHLAKARSRRWGWSRELFRLAVADAFQLVLFVYLHELYHYLIAAAGRTPRRREAMCDRFATRRLVDAFGCEVTDVSGRSVDRSLWDFQELESFVGAAPRERLAAAGRRPIPVRIAGLE